MIHVATQADWIKVELTAAEQNDARRAASGRAARARQGRARLNETTGVSSYRAHWLSVLSEDAVSKYEGRPVVRDGWADDLARGWDDGMGWAVRACEKPTNRLFLRSRERTGRWLLALMHESPGTIWLAGWITAEEFWKLRPTPRRKDQNLFWTIDHAHLHPLPEKPGFPRYGESWLVDPDTPFWCEVCGGTHPIIEHRVCRGCLP